MGQLADTSCKVYRDVTSRKEFVSFFRAATPEQELAMLNIGSRPTRRKTDGYFNLKFNFNTIISIK